MATPEEIQRLLNELQAAYDRLGAINPFENFDTSNIQNAEATTRRLQAALDGVNSRLERTESDLEGIVGAFKASVNEISKTNTALGNTKSIFSSLTSLSQKLRYDQEGISKLNVKELTSIKEKIQQKKIELKDNLSLLEYRKQELIAENQSSETSLTQKRKNREEIQRLNSAIAASNAEYKNQEGFSQELIKYAQDRLDLEEEIAGTLGVKTFGAVSDITKAIPGLSRFSTPFQEAEEAARKQAESNKKLFGSVDGVSKKELEALKTGKGLTKELAERFKLYDKNGKALAGAAGASKAQATGLTKAASSAMGPLKAGFKTLFTTLKSSLTKALGPVGLIIDLLMAIKESDKIVGNMAKGLNLSYDNALAMKQELTAAANESGSIFVTSKGMAETLMAINKTLGTNVMLNKEDLATFTELRTVAGFTNEELMGIQALSLATGKSLEDNTKEFMAQAKISAMQNGILLNEKELAKGIKDVSAATTLSFAKNPKLIGEAVATAKALGMELSKVEGIADKLLSFEQSIENELQAELLLGRDINLEKARQAALNNDLTTVAEEIAKQVGDSADFAKMNRIEQQALADAVGMSREELAKTLFVQDQLKGATGKQAEEQEALLNARIEAVGLAQAQKELEEKGFEGLKNQASMQDRFNASIEKLKEIFVLIGEAIMPILDVFVGIFEIVGPLIKILNPFLQASLIPLSLLADLLDTIVYAGKLVLNLFGAKFDTSNFEFGKKTVARGNQMLEGFGVDSEKYGAKGGIKINTGDLSYDAQKGKLKTSPKEGGLMGPMITTPDGKVFEGTKNDDILMAPGVSKMLNPVQSIDNAITPPTPQPTQPIINNNIDQPITSPVNNIIKTPTLPPPVVMAAPTPAPTVDNEKTEKAIGETNTLLKQILNKQGTVKMNTTDVGTSFSMNTFNVQ